MPNNQSAHVQPISDLPPIADDAGSNVSFCLNDEGVLWLAYEVRRDFLSAPRLFNILRVDLAEEALIATGGQYLNDLQWEALRKSGYGVYRVDGGELIENEHELHLVCYTPKQLLECCALQVTAQQQSFHSSSPYQALAAFLTSQS